MNGCLCLFYRQDRTRLIGRLAVSLALLLLFAASGVGLIGVPPIPFLSSLFLDSARCLGVYNLRQDIGTYMPCLTWVFHIPIVCLSGVLWIKVG